MRPVAHSALLFLSVAAPIAFIGYAVDERQRTGIT